jgi:hypothetical protein
LRTKAFLQRALVKGKGKNFKSGLADKHKGKSTKEKKEKNYLNNASGLASSEALNRCIK